MSDILTLDKVTRTFGSGDEQLHILRGADLTLRAGEITALVAPSGSGKSTLLHLAGLLEGADSGTIRIGGIDTGRLSDSERTRLRRDEIGFVYQSHHLLAEFTALENVAIPQMIAGKSRADAEARAATLLAAFGLTNRANHLPGKLSGGERQRVAIARAMANAPKLLLADEPTGNLDVATADIVFNEMLRAVRGENIAALIATHNPDLAARMDRTIILRDGLLVAS
ncbi:ABC transporter ATP-binding protein [Acidiphilium acidophilum]|uniref:ABC transporter ATP-binding protein n=1 Tax=Acidiphilium acidophilum TaxID=76588 RepID=A0AAW9DP62_ACIAO|nr:ABC transporter ATP-binding protein [Acidiphilium acidophilum]MDX5930696.1 ABC transporter ATP-binding protein [Acidiphilium acidophilum]GBR73784.1 lipoprotein releasing system ATP-binding protein LolD [Acidiphilium acidophilum DSM 700]